jgi:predicted component of type VI protein secretion system
METKYGKLLRLLNTAKEEALEYRNHKTVAYSARNIGLDDKAKSEEAKAAQALILLRATLSDINDLTEGL